MTSTPHDGYYEAYWPRSERQQTDLKLAPRLSSLEGKTVAFLWDDLFKGDVIFALPEEALAAKFQGIKFVGWKELGSWHSGNERALLAALPEKLKQRGVDAVVCGIAC